MSIIIEVSGVSCAGKSALFPLLFDCLNQAESRFTDSFTFTHFLAAQKIEKYVRKVFPESLIIWITDLMKKLLILNSFLKSRPLGSHKRVAGYIYKYGRSIKCFRSYLVKLGIHQLVKKSLKNRSVLVDEGIVHTVQSIFVSQAQPVKKKPGLRYDLEAYLCSIPLPDILVVVYNRNQQLLNQRLLKRGHHRTRVANFSARKQFIENSIYVEELMLEILSERREIQIIKLPADDSYFWASAAKTIQKSLKELSYGVKI